jgi:cold shock CspA family protein
MPTDFGMVDFYSPRGYGFVSHTLYPKSGSRSGVFFHIKTVKHDAPHLVRPLEGDAWIDLSFWYEFEPLARGDQVIHLWPEAGGIPADRREALVAHVETHWRGASKTFQRAARELLGPERYEELAAR